MGTALEAEGLGEVMEESVSTPLFSSHFSPREPSFLPPGPGHRKSSIMGTSPKRK